MESNDAGGQLGSPRNLLLFDKKRLSYMVPPHSFQCETSLRSFSSVHPDCVARHVMSLQVAAIPQESGALTDFQERKLF